MGNIYLGIDIGTTSAKCMSVREDGVVLAVAQQPYGMSHPKPGWAEQDPEDYWRGLVATVREVVSKCGGDACRIALSTQGDTLIVADGEGKQLLPATSWMDTRGEQEFAEFQREGDSSLWYRETGSPPHIYSSAWAIQWLRRNRPEMFKQDVRFCYVADWLAKRLCGRFATDAPSASWTPLFSPAKRDWSQPVLDMLCVSGEDLPHVLESGEVAGKLLPEVARELMLPEHTELVAGAFDQAAAAHGAGARADGRAVLSCGTAWVLYAVAPGEVSDPKMQLCTCCHAGRGQMGLVLPSPGGSTYDWLTRVSGGTDDEEPASDESLVFVPHLYGGLSPDWRAESKGSILGLRLTHTRADICSALMRGLACETRRNLEAAEPLSGRIHSIRMVGGAAKSRKWPQMVANVLNRRIEVSNEPETACYGAAMLAAGAASDCWADRAPVTEFQPNASGASVEEQLYERYLRVYESINPIYKGIAV